MNSRVQYSALSRLLTLNNQVHDLEHELRMVAVPVGKVVEDPWLSVIASNRVAELQEEIDRGVRASLTTCWLAMPGELEA